MPNTRHLPPVRVRPHIYLALFKPYNVLSEFEDPEGRPTLAGLLPLPGLSVAGRLDQDSEGLLLLTDDGELAHRLTHPSYHVPKTYLVQVEGDPVARSIASLRKGVLVKGETTAPADVERMAADPDLPPRPVPVRENAAVPTAWLKMVLREGRKHQVRHMTAAVGCPALRVVRVAIGPVTLKGLQPGESRHLTPNELAGLRRFVSSS